MKYSKIIKNKRVSWIWLIIAVYPISWLLLINSFGDNHSFRREFTDLTFISSFSTALIIWSLRKNYLEKIHLWSIYGIFFVGHYIKFYLLLFWSQTDPQKLKTAAVYKVTIALLKSPDAIMQYYRIATYLSCWLAILFLYLKFFHFDSNKKNKDKYISNNNYEEKNNYVKHKSKYEPKRLKGFISIFLAISCFVFGLILLFYWTQYRLFSKGYIPSLGGLPILGILNYSSTLLIPGIYLLLIRVSKIQRNIITLRLSISLFVIYSILISLTTTSKGNILIPFISIFLLEVFSKTLTSKKIFIYLLIALTVLPFSISFLHNLRVSISFAKIIGNFNSFNDLGILITDAYQSTFAFGGDSDKLPAAMTFILRVNGVDTLMPIIDYCQIFDIDISWNRIASLLSSDINAEFASKVVGLSLKGVGFSTGLTGLFYFLAPKSIALSFLFSIYVLLWHFIFSYLSRLNLYSKPVIATNFFAFMLFSFLEGGISIIPFILLIILGFFSEIFVRFLLKIGYT